MSGTAGTSVLRLKELVLICGAGVTMFAGYSICEGNEKFYRQFVMPGIRFLDPETTHNLVIFMAKNRLAPPQTDPPILRTKVWDRGFPNPVGVASGFDKDAVAVDGMLGAGFVEVGSVTPKPQPGNPKTSYLQTLGGQSSYKQVWIQQ